MLKTHHPAQGRYRLTKILIVEDNENDLYLSSYILRHEGFEVITAGDGDDGIRLALEERPDLILTDLHLLNVDGYQVIQTLKSRADTKAIPIVAITVFVYPIDRQRAYDAGCDGFIEKPFVWETLVQQVRSYLPA
jgi:two-component system cell cycle response regulator DivK